MFLNSTSDPGRYDPIYSLVRKREPVIYIGYPNEKIKDNKLKKVKSCSQNNKTFTKMQEHFYSRMEKENNLNNILISQFIQQIKK